MEQQTINIAICDDNEAAVNLIYNKITEIINNINKPITLYKFISSNELFKSFKKNFYDLLFLDIEMKPRSGGDIAKYVNNNLKSTKIVFVTNHDEISHAMYRYAPIAFIRKSNFDKDLEDNIDIIFDKLNIFYTYYIITENKISRRIKMSDICYIKSNGNNIEIHMKDKSFIAQRKTFKAVVRELNTGYIVQINKGILVNVLFIEQLGDENKLCIDNVFLEDGTSFYINANYYDDVKTKFFKYTDN